MLGQGGQHGLEALGGGAQVQLAQPGGRGGEAGGEGGGEEEAEPGEEQEQRVSAARWQLFRGFAPSA